MIDWIILISILFLIALIIASVFWHAKKAILDKMFKKNDITKDIYDKYLYD